jgi:hypothetical protein
MRGRSFLIVLNGTPGGDRTDGIRVLAGAVGNFIIGNHLRENVDHDCHEDGPRDNVWEHNKGETENQPGLCRRSTARRGVSTARPSRASIARRCTSAARRNFVRSSDVQSRTSTRLPFAP